MTSNLKDPVSGLTHLLGALLSSAGLALLVTLAAFQATTWHVVSFSVYGSSMILLYATSALYHLLPLSAKGTRMFRTLDHIMIYLFIAGTYTPICLAPLRGAWGWSILGVVWGLAVGGLFFKLFWLEAPRWISTGIYLLMGWTCLAAIYPLVLKIPSGGLFWLVLGGLFYTVGGVIYGLKRPDPVPGVFGFHEIFHLLVMAGSFCHFWMMLRYILYLS
ncbi:MAG: hemolysin III family protein [Pseudomonadota bacterium]